MESFIRKLINTSFGFASAATKRTAETINNLIKEGKISEEEGKKILDELEKEGGEQRAEFEMELKSMMEKILKKMNIPSQGDIERLEKRLDVLEKSRYSSPGPDK